MSTIEGLILQGNKPPIGGRAPSYTPLGRSVYESLGIEPEPERTYPFGRFVEALNAGIGIGFLSPLEFIHPVKRYTDSLRATAAAASSGPLSSADVALGKIGTASSLFFQSGMRPELMGTIPKVLEHIDEENYRGSSAEVGQGLGFLTGFLVPTGVAGKIGGYGVRGIQAVTGVRMLQAAEAGAELTRVGVLTQGAIAGGLLSIGMEPGEGHTRTGNVAIGMVAGGLGDVALQSAWRLISAKSTLRSFINSETRQSAEEILETGVTREATAQEMGRAARLMNRLTRRTNIHGDDIADTIANRKTNLILGMDELGLSSLQPGEATIIPALGAKLEDIKATLGTIPDIEYAITSRTTRTGRLQHDILVGPVEGFNKDLVKTFNKYGYIPGQQAVWRGKSYILSRNAENPLYVIGVDAAGNRTSILRSEMELGTIVDPGLKSQKIINPDRQWLRFVNQHGAFPGTTGELASTEVRGIEMGYPEEYVLKYPDTANARQLIHRNTIPGEKPWRVTGLTSAAKPTRHNAFDTIEEAIDFAKGIGFTREITRHQQPILGFDAAFNAFIAESKLTPAAKQSLKTYFTQRQNALLREVDDGELGRLLDNVTSVHTGRMSHPEGDLEELAAQKGLVRKRIMIPVKKPKRGKKYKWGHALVDIDTGEAHGPFTTPALVREFIHSYGKDMTQIDIGNPLAEGATGLLQKGTFITQLLNQAELSNANIPWDTMLMGKVTPYLHFIRRANDALIREVGEAAPDVYGKYSNLLAQMAVQRSEAAPWLEQLTKIRGGGVFRSSKIRVDRMEGIADLLESGAPGSADWSAVANERGLNQTERGVATQLRKFYNDIFKVAEESGNIDITADDFIENYMPHIMRRGHDNWVETFTRAHGRPPSIRMREFVHEFERTGELTRYEKDPFVVAYRYTDALFFKKNVSNHWRELKELIDTIPEQRADTREANYGLVQIKQTLMDTMAMLRGSAITTDYTTRAAMQSVSKQLNIHLDEKTIDRTISTLISANYGAFMGWRPALAVRNLSQIIMTGLPLLGPKYIGVGLRNAMKEGAEAELHQMGVIAKGAYGLPFQDALYYDTVKRAVTGGTRGATASKIAAKTGQVIRAATQKSLWMQGATDSINRRVIYYGAKEKMLDSLTRWSREGWSREVFDAKSGLSASGPSVTKSFHLMNPRENPIEAAKWYAAQLTGDSQFVYQQGAGPTAFNTRAGKLFGMYGTWPSWMGSLIQQRLKYGTASDKTRFIGYTIAAHFAFLNAAYFTGINLSKWTGLDFGWAGGPAFDVVKDLSSIVGGEQASGEPTAERELALSKYGVRDTGDGLFQVKDPRKLIEGTAGLFFPGAYVVRDVVKGAEMVEDHPVRGTLRAAGFQMGEQ